MKKTLLAAIIAATALVPPVLAQDRGHRWGGGDRSGGNAGASQPAQQQERGDRGDRGGGDRGGWRQPSGQPQQPQQQQPQQPRGGWNRGGWTGGQPGGQVSPPQAQPPQQRWDGNRGGNDRRDWNRDGNRGGQWDRGNRDRNWNNDRRGNDWNRNNDRGWNDRNRWDNNPRGGWNRGGWAGNDRGRWNNGWRNDRRYDWRDYRNSNRGIYRLPRYYAPSGWGYGYRRFTIGYTLNSILFSSQYWINDPFYYRLPEVYGPYRWVRYYNDALLVDIDTGEVVDTIYDIFW
ncbi:MULTISPECIES: RcnB family protein [unclassified Sphingomonas]|jgi:Nickel/cobalt transporter regulator|nr:MULTISPECIES: RcnB family protein [unclassified Sphingomonas]